MRPIRVILADDDPSVVAMLRIVLETEDGFEVAGTASDAEGAIEVAMATRPDLALLDVDMPGGGGARAAAEIKARLPGVRVVALSGYDERETAIRMLRAGATGYLVKGGSVDELVSTLIEVAEGNARLSRSVAEGVLRELTASHASHESDASERSAIARRIDHVIANGYLDVEFQPIMGLNDGGTTGLEALARFRGEPVQPPDVWFVEAALVGRRIDLEIAAAAAAASSVSSLPPGAYVSINASPEVVGEESFREALEIVPAERLVIEVTEHMPVEDYHALNRAIEDLRRRGARLAIDDVGAGFASLRHILLLNPDIIKLDVSIVHGIDGDPARRALASALVSFAREIDATLIAEGVESARELAALRDLGVGFGQGFYLSPPRRFVATGPSGHIVANAG